MSVEETKPLGTVGGVVGRVQIDSDATNSVPQAADMALDHNISQFFGHAEEFFRRRRIFKAKKRRLRTQILPVDRIAVEHEFLNGIVGKGVSVIAVGISGSNSVDPLPEKHAAAMDDLSLLPAVADTLGDSIGERQLVVDRLQEDGTTIRAAVGVDRRKR